jgi:hypothetical protein
MIISLVNFSDKKDEEVQRVIRAINRQIAQDYEPYWHMGAQLRLEGRASSKPTADKSQPQELRGDAILYLWDEEDVEDALGYHDANFLGLPFGIVFTKLSEELGEAWSVTLSHEALELIGDASANAFAAGPHPADPNRLVFHWYEMCDAVQAESYEIDHVAVSNFVLPLYFSIGDEKGSRNDFLGTKTRNSTLASFGVNPGGYIGFFDPKTGKHSTYTGERDAKAKRRMKIKAKAQLGRRAVRYQQFTTKGAWRALATRPLGLALKMGSSGTRRKRK